MAQGAEGPDRVADAGELRDAAPIDSPSAPIGSDPGDAPMDPPEAATPIAEPPTAPVEPLTVPAAEPPTAPARAGNRATRPAPVARVVREGGSPSMVRWVGRIDSWLPAIGPFVGFWASVYARFARHRGSVLSGGLAFFALLSLVPAVLSLGALAALLLGSQDFMEDIETLTGSGSTLAGWLRPVLAGVVDAGATDVRTLGIAGVVGLVVSLYAASRFVYVGRQVLDIAFELEPEPPSFLWRALAIVLTLVLQVVIVLGVAVLAVVPRVLAALGLENVTLAAFQLVQIPAIMAIFYLMLTASMRFGTRARRVVRWASPGALVGTVIVALGTIGLGWYLSVSNTYSQIVATLGSVIALELWFFVLCTAIVVAAEIEGVRHGFDRRDVVGADGTRTVVPDPG